MTTEGSDFRVQVSPDGRELLYTPAVPLGDESPTPLLAIPLAGGAPRRVLPCVREFATNAIGVYYTTCGPGPVREMHLLEAAGARDSMIGRARDTGFGGLDTPAVSPDGKPVLVPRGEFTRDLILVENFR